MVMGRRIILVISVIATIGTVVLAADAPPSKYHLSEVTITLGHFQYAYSVKYKDAAVFSGTGQVDYTRDDSGETLERSFRIDQQMFQRLLRDIYDIHFFTLEDSYIARPELDIGDDGAVDAIVSLVNHQWQTQLTISIKEYEKSVHFCTHGIPPVGVKEFAKHLEGIVEEYVPELRRP